ncbi:MAG: GIY-YIG nuclease family protein [Deltaproteobacteria bacterium]|nr:MAG: GIY-YIG nuclease family protein [Deltaproteobacteria bacterium]
MPFCTYVLRSQSTGKLYIGHTSDLKRRLREHNDPNLGKNRYTRKQKGPWILIHKEPFQTRTEAMRREKFLKSGQGRKWIKETVLHSEQNC